MKRFIDATELRMKVQRTMIPNADEVGMVFVNDAERFFLKLIEDQPTADVEEVVKCKNCKYCKSSNDLFFCTLYGIAEVPADYYCYYGERKDA